MFPQHVMPQHSRRQYNYDEVTIILSSWTREKGKSGISQNEVIPSAGYLKEMELFSCKSDQKDLIFVDVKGKLQMRNLCFLFPAM